MTKSMCPCQSGQYYLDCCAPYHQHKAQPESADVLMRSRYSAYTLCHIGYIVETTVPAQQALLDQHAMRNWAEETNWQGLEILRRQPFITPKHSLVHFKAFFQTEMGVEAHEEHSLFVLIENRWYFVDPTVPLPNQKQPCICGSGKKFKHCCGAWLVR